MYVLLDENLDWRLTRDFDRDFEVSTVLWQGWKGKRNSELLQLAETEFDTLVTMDKGFEHQLNLSKYAIGVIIISARSNLLREIQPTMPKVNQALRKVQYGQIIHVTANA